VSLIPRIEEILLLAIWKLEDQAYGVEIIEQVEKDTGISWLSGSIYGALTRLKKNGYVTSVKTGYSSGQAGRPRIYYQLTSSGLKELIRIQQINQGIWKGVPDLKKVG